VFDQLNGWAFPLVCLALAFGYDVVHGRQKRLRAAAPRLAASFLRIGIPPQERRPATPESHPTADWSALDRVRAELEDRGFRSVGDVEQVLSHPVKLRRPPILRYYVARDGSAAAWNFQAQRRRSLLTALGVLLRRPALGGNVLGLVTLFEDGTLVATGKTTSPFQAPPWAERLPMTASTEDVVARHRSRVFEHGGGMRVLTTLEDAFAAETASIEATRHFRESIGFVTREELVRFNRGLVFRLNKRTLDTLLTEVRGEIDRQLVAAGG
jgi:hypothetical protein